MNKKGDVFQIFFIMIILFCIALIGLLFGVLAYRFSGALGESSLFNDAPLAQSANELTKTMSWSVGEEFIFFFFFGANIALIIAAARTRFSPVVIFLFILLVLMAILVASGFVNIYSTFADEPSIADYTVHKTITNLIFSKYFPIMISIISAIILVIMYGKSGNEIAV